MAPTPRTTSLLTEFGHLISWHRRKLAVLAAVSAAALGITAATPDPPPTTAVVVAGQQLTGGQQLAAADLDVRRLPADLVPAGAVTDARSLVGRTLVAPLTEGSVLTRVSVLGSRQQVGAGMVIAPLRISDPAVVALVRVGDRVDVVAASPESGHGAQVIAEQLRVVTIPRTDGGSAPLAADGADAETLLLVAARPKQAELLAEAATRSQLSVLLS